MAARADFTGGSSTNTEAIAIPTFGKQPMLGTSPLAFCMPADPCDFLFDCATAVVPRGKITWPPKLDFLGSHPILLKSIHSESNGFLCVYDSL